MGLPGFHQGPEYRHPNVARPSNYPQLESYGPFLVVLRWSLFGGTQNLVEVGWKVLVVGLSSQRHPQRRPHIYENSHIQFSRPVSPSSQLMLGHSRRQGVRYSNCLEHHAPRMVIKPQGHLTHGYSGFYPGAPNSLK